VDSLSNLAVGFAAALSATNLLFCLIGALLGTLIGVLPGIGPITTIALLLPLTLALSPLTALIMLAGIYYGAQYGGSTTAILINLPASRLPSSRPSMATRWHARAARARRLLLPRSGHSLRVASARS
jgi:TctA family transporter